MEEHHKMCVQWDQQSFSWSFVQETLEVIIIYISDICSSIGSAKELGFSRDNRFLFFKSFLLFQSHNITFELLILFGDFGNFLVKNGSILTMCLLISRLKNG
jgi:hypothetical protein